MQRSDIEELHYITPIANVLSILRHGILSNQQMRKLQHNSVAMLEIQQRRKDKKIPGAGHLHDYANLYFDAHNPMLSKVRAHNDKICVLRVAPKVLDLPDVIIADRNASSDYVRFYRANEGLASIDKDKLFARYWTNSPNPYERMAHKSLKCAEVLVPEKVERRYIIGAYVANQPALKSFKTLNSELTISIKNDIFF